MRTGAINRISIATAISARTAPRWRFRCRRAWRINSSGSFSNARMFRRSSKGPQPRPISFREPTSTRREAPNDASHLIQMMGLDTHMMPGDRL